MAFPWHPAPHIYIYLSIQISRIFYSLSDNWDHVDNLYMKHSADTKPNKDYDLFVSVLFNNDASWKLEYVMFALQYHPIFIVLPGFFIFQQHLQKRTVEKKHVPNQTMQNDTKKQAHMINLQIGFAMAWTKLTFILRLYLSIIQANMTPK